jgi:hypothetical protein
MAGRRLADSWSRATPFDRVNKPEYYYMNKLLNCNPF